MFCTFVCGCMYVELWVLSFTLQLEKFLFIPTICFLFLKYDRLYPLNYCALRGPKETCFYGNRIYNSLLNA